MSAGMLDFKDSMRRGRKKTKQILLEPAANYYQLKTGVRQTGQIQAGIVGPASQLGIINLLPWGCTFFTAGRDRSEVMRLLGWREGDVPHLNKKWHSFANQWLTSEWITSYEPCCYCFQHFAFFCRKNVFFPLTTTTNNSLISNSWWCALWGDLHFIIF